MFLSDFAEKGLFKGKETVFLEPGSFEGLIIRISLPWLLLSSLVSLALSYWCAILNMVKLYWSQNVQLHN